MTTGRAKPVLPLLVAALSVLAALQVACGGIATIDPAAASTGTAGSGGATTTTTGGLGGTGGSGGAGGALPPCPTEIQQSVSLSSPHVGFDHPPGEPLLATIEHVDSNLLYLAPAGPGNVGLFEWSGPSLIDWFQPGEAVELQVDEGWHVVKGVHWAATLMFLTFVAPELLPSPHWTPLFSLSEQCAFLESSGGCGQPPAAVEVFELSLTIGDFLGPNVPYGQTVDTGSYLVHNANTAQLPSYSSEDCDMEPAFVSIATVLLKASP